MTLDFPATVKNASALEQGELFKASWGSEGFTAICLGREPREGTHGLLIFSLREWGEGPFYADLQLNDVVVASLGTNWLATFRPEALGYPGDMQATQLAGSLILTPKSSLVCCHQARSRLPTRMAFIDLSTLTLANWPNNYAIVQVQEWELWTRTRDRERPGAKPFLTIKAAAPTS